MKTTVEGKIEGKRVRGRQRYRWVVNVRTGWIQLDQDHRKKKRDKARCRDTAANLHEKTAPDDGD